ncbi:M15 family metallopeptidase [Nocardioides sp. HDW12B]|uniref:M15 family metallopeptidase n=1 Tax=Nocardioides sp. HDW12B TaxID=2714939 RepID=UPI00140887C0|nr:M15 family metallopeptidase [Nocardioides sp. HDW12B]QIK67886.1 M15 family metallopeptidase [Nocardioides sp. HDW12B]
MSPRPARWRRALVASQVLALGLLVAACNQDSLVDNVSDEASPSTGEVAEPGSGKDESAGGDQPAPEATEAAEGDSSYAVDAPGDFEKLYTSDALITSTEPLSDEMVKRVTAIKGVDAAVPMSWASASINGRTLDIAAVDATAFRGFMPVATAQADFVWERLAGGEVVVDDEVDKKLVDKGDMFQLGSDDDSPSVHVGAYAPLHDELDKVTPFDVIMNAKRGDQVGLPAGNALLLSTGSLTPSELKKDFDKVLDDDTVLRTLAIEFDVEQTAVLTGESVNEAIGTFSYTDGPDGTVIPEQSWVNEYIRTEEVPILGTVTCNKGMLPQLRGALNEIVQMGLADEINPDEYAGCYYPRYINRSPEYGLSLHSWGIAVDLNVPGNQRGTVGEMDRGVVAIFKEWGFAWGGDWSYTDPMHFEMAKVVR